jgi:hypothetical protein
MLSRSRVGLAVLVFIAALPVLSQGADDRPAGVSKDQWVKLGDSAGIAITNRAPQSAGKVGGEAKGELWVKLAGTWSPAVLEQSHQFVQAR